EAAVRSSGDHRLGAAAAVVYRRLEDPALPVAGSAQEWAWPETVVCGLGGGGGGRSAGRTPRPGESAGHQAQDEQLEEKASRTSPLSSAHQEVPPKRGHQVLSGIVTS